MWPRPQHLRAVPLRLGKQFLCPLPSSSLLLRSYSTPAPLRQVMPSSHRFTNDRIIIDQLSLKCVCGKDAFGRRKAQPVKVSVELGTCIARAAADDRVELSVDYSALVKQLSKLEETSYEEVDHLLERIALLGLENELVGNVHIKAELEKGSLNAERVVWEKSAHVEDGIQRRTLNCRVEGIQLPIIIGIEENEHERTQKQPILIDLAWQEYQGDSRAQSSFDLKQIVNTVVSRVLETTYQSIESLASLIVDIAAHPQFKNVQVTVRKPRAIPFGKAAGVSITREYRPPSSNSEQEVYIALGSNLGDRLRTMERALQLLNEANVEILMVSGLYESEPMYVQEQPQFLNAVCKARTTLPPRELLATLKRIESESGRIPTIRNGPRALDLDILLYGSQILNAEDLIIPHLSMLERGFVLQPLADIAPDLKHPVTLASIQDHLRALPPPSQHNLLQLPSSSLTFDVSRHRKSTLIMAILNLTPDSFSDGGKHSLNPDQIVETVKSMISHGAHIIDIGGQSTRPNAPQVSTQEELDRILPAIEAIRKEGITRPISIDTYRAKVAETAISAGADIINDVSAGQLDPDMLSTAAKLNVPIILMHMRGTPITMNSLAEYDGDLVEIVGRELAARVEEAARAGIRRWNILLDPGLGFAKIGRHNLEIMRRLSELRAHRGLSGMPWVLGPSRKRFIEGITGENVPVERIFGTAGAIAACVQGGADIVRVHDVGEMSKLVKMSDAIWRDVL